VLLTVAVFNGAFTTLRAMHDAGEKGEPALVPLQAALLRALTMVGLFASQRAVRRRGLLTSGFLHCNWLIQVTCAAPELYHR
jgi:hypothetical protein